MHLQCQCVLHDPNHYIITLFRHSFLVALCHMLIGNAELVFTEARVCHNIGLLHMHSSNSNIEATCPILSDQPHKCR